MKAGALEVPGAPRIITADKARVAVLLSGEGTNMAALLYASRLPGSPFEIVLVSGDRPDAPGLVWARSEGVPVLLPEAEQRDKAAFYAQLDAGLRKARVDTIALAGFMRILPDDFVAQWDGQILNIHPSLLPRYKGLDTHMKAIEAGDRHAGCSVHLVNSEVDSGELLGQISIIIRSGDTPASLAERVRVAEHQLFPAVLADHVSRHQDATWLERRVDALAARLPEVTRKTSHGAPGWAVGSDKGGKLFAILADRHHGEDAIGLLVKAGGPDEMTSLIEARPDSYYWPKYYGASGWLGLKLNRRDVDWDQVAKWLERSWRDRAPTRLTRMIRAADEF